MTLQVAVLSPVGTDERLTVSSVAVSFATTWPNSATHVFIDVQDNDVMVTFDGSTPTSSNGHRFRSGDSAVWSKATATAAKFIRQGASDGVVHATPFTY